MISSIYSKMAGTNIKKNYRFFIPRILTESGLLGCFFIILTLARDKRLASLEGGDYLPTFMWMGVIIIGLLSAVIMFYTNSFLMKQRKREFGLYNILGMEKRHIGKILFFESIYNSGISLLLGTAIGIIFYKLCSLLVCKLLDAEIILGFYYIKISTILPAALFFLLIDLITFLVNRIIIAALKPVELLDSVHTGEKEPKVKWPLLVIGLLTMGGGYGLALTIKSPLGALNYFFAAVILVIIGTYFLFVSGSIFILKWLKRNKKFYYNKKHMTSVSGLTYRMKQHAVGLASICILATGVLVMMSTTISLYAGMEDVLKKHYPEDYYLEVCYSKDGEKNTLDSDLLVPKMEQGAKSLGLEIEYIKKLKYMTVGFLLDEDRLIYDQNNPEYSSLDIMDKMAFIVFITEDEYNSLTGKNLELNRGEIAIWPYNIFDRYKYDTMEIMDDVYSVNCELSSFPIASVISSAYKSYGIVVDSEDTFNYLYDRQREIYGKDASDIEDRLGVKFVDSDIVAQNINEFDLTVDEIIKEVLETTVGEYDYYNRFEDLIWEAKESLYGMFGTLLFLGIILGMVCLFATVLIIYYKQISEGFEDRNRFQIMKKIGMSNKEVRNTVHSQVMMIFFAPLLVAGVHICVAFPMLLKILKVFQLASTSFFVICTAIVYIVFAAIYGIIYSATSKTYYGIVN